MRYNVFQVMLCSLFYPSEKFKAKREHNKWKPRLLEETIMIIC